MQTLTDTPPPATVRPKATPRVTSIDALRGLTIFTMIFVNDIASVSPTIVPDWMRHYHGKSGMTFVDLVFPAFLFIAGMSIPFALGSRMSKGESLWKTISHILTRTAFLLLVGVMMVNKVPDSTQMGWSSTLWCVLMYVSAILAFCSIRLPGKSGTSSRATRMSSIFSIVLRCLGLAILVFLAFAFVGKDNQRIITLSPFNINTSYYGILGLIGWAYLVSSLVYLTFRTHRTALLGCIALLFCLYIADRKGAFDDLWVAHRISIGETLGSQAAISLAGALLATVLITAGTTSPRSRANFTLLFIAGCSAGALLLHPLYGISKNSATPSWCLWSCAITAALWLGFYFLADVKPESRWAKLSVPFGIAGGNVLLAYLFSEMLSSVLRLLSLGHWYSSLAEPNLACAIARSAGCGAALLTLTALLNRLGFRLKL